MKNLSGSVLISRDTFLDVLQLQAAREKLRERERIDDLYLALVDFLSDQDESPVIDLPQAYEPRGLDLKVPGMPVHINLSRFIFDKLESFVAAYLIIDGATQDNYMKVTAAIVVGFMNKLTYLRKHYGELCAVESLAEVATKGTKDVCLNLFGKPCRYPKANCQFLEKEMGVCNFELKAIEQTLEALGKKSVVEKANNSEPIIWKITV